MNTLPYLNKYTERLISAALAEDIGGGDITTDAIVEPNKTGRAKIIAKERLVLCGLLIAEKAFTLVDKALVFKGLVKDGAGVKKGGVIATVSGRCASMLSAERVALNFLQRLSGIATVTREFTRKIKNTGVEILDTRKTTPCLRLLEKYAVKTGGGKNHRFGLFDAIIIKDNHIHASGGVKEAIRRVKEKYPNAAAIEVEVKNLKEVLAALNGNADVIMLDNMNVKEIKKAICLINGKAKVEVSGGVTLKNIRAIARTRPDYISIGALTHSARAVDISLEIDRD